MNLDPKLNNEKLKTEEFLISNNLLFSKKEIEIEILTEIPEIEILTKNILENNIYIIKNLNKIINEKNKIIIFEEIKKFEEIKNKIENKFKENKSEFKKIDDEDYDFIEKTSQIEILTGILEKVENNPSFFKIKSKIQEYINDNENKEEKIKIDLHNKEIEYEEIIEKLEQELNSSKKNITLLENEKSNLLLKRSNLEIEKTKLENFLSDNEKREKIKKEIEDFERKIHKLKFEIEENKLDMKILKTKVLNINSQISNGKIKNINIILYILTLGLIHWTKFSDNKYLKNKIQNKINLKQEKQLEIEKKIHKIKNEIDEKQFNEKIILEEFSKKQEKVIKNIEEIETKFKTIKIEEKEINIKLEEKLKEKNKILKEFEKIKEKFEEIEKEEEDLKKNSINNIKKILEDINKQRNNNINEISDLIKKIKNQKINIEGNYKIKV